MASIQKRMEYHIPMDAENHMTVTPFQVMMHTMYGNKDYDYPEKFRRILDSIGKSDAVLLTLKQIRSVVFKLVNYLMDYTPNKVNAYFQKLNKLFSLSERNKYYVSRENPEGLINEFSSFLEKYKFSPSKRFEEIYDQFLKKEKPLQIYWIEEVVPMIEQWGQTYKSNYKQTQIWSIFMFYVEYILVYHVSPKFEWRDFIKVITSFVYDFSYQTSTDKKGPSDKNVRTLLFQFAIIDFADIISESITDSSILVLQDGTEEFEFREESYPRIGDDEKSECTVSSCWTRKDVSMMFKESHVSSSIPTSTESSDSDLMNSFRMLENLKKMKSQVMGAEQEWKTKLKTLEEKKEKLLHELDKVNQEIDSIHIHMESSTNKNTELYEIDEKIKEYLQKVTSAMNL